MTVILGSCSFRGSVHDSGGKTGRQGAGKGTENCTSWSKGSQDHTCKMWTIQVCMWKHTGKTHLHALYNENQLGRVLNWSSLRLKRNSRIPKKITERLETRNVFLVKEPVPRCAGAHLPCRPWGDRGRNSRTPSHPQLYWEFKASLGYGRISLNPPYHPRTVSLFVVNREDSYFVETFLWPKSRFWMFELLLLTGLFPG